MNAKLELSSDCILAHATEISTYSSFKVFRGDCHLVVMKALPCVHCEANLTCFVCYAISHHFAEHHLAAIHEIVHYIFYGWHQGIFVNKDEVNLLVSHNLNPYISTDEENVASCVIDDVVLFPFSTLLINFEKHNRARRSNNKCLIKEHKHVSKILISDVFFCELCNVSRVNRDTIALSIKGSEVVSHRAVE